VVALRVAEVARDRRDDYKTAVRALGANILRSGLSAALADLKRRKADDVLADTDAAADASSRAGDRPVTHCCVGATRPSWAIILQSGTGLGAVNVTLFPDAAGCCSAEGSVPTRGVCHS
jgi:hypothetical protein